MFLPESKCLWIEPGVCERRSTDEAIPNHRLPEWENDNVNQKVSVPLLQNNSEYECALDPRVVRSILITGTFVGNPCFTSIALEVKPGLLIPCVSVKGKQKTYPSGL